MIEGNKDCGFFKDVEGFTPFISLRKKYIEPPFSVLNSRSRRWQDRKRKWLELGIKSEIGRKSTGCNTFEDLKNRKNKTDCIKRILSIGGQSIFDPVLCELMYKWFCSDNGYILDPFAGGSVRGIVANYLGYKYIGIELSEKQIKSNKEQAMEILSKNNQPEWIIGDSDEILNNKIFIKKKKIKISVPSLKQKFQLCEPDYIQNICYGKCCESNKGLMVTIHDSEKDYFIKKGITIENNFIKDNNNGICPFKKQFLCNIHNDKPFGCKASPFTLSKNGVLIIRNRYRLLECYNTEDSISAYEAHKWSLIQIFGEKETNRIIDDIKKGKNEIYGEIDYNKYIMLIENDVYKHNDRFIEKDWYKEQFDFIFSCPPYMDLEIYSDDKDDLSNMSDEDFIKKYESIINKSCKLLKKNCYACFVVGEVRDKKTGFYKDFIGITKKAFFRAGLKLYNEIILLNVIGSASIRCENAFKKNRKVVKIHQNILIFKKV